MGNTPVDHPVYIQAVEYMKEFVAVFEFELIRSGSELFRLSSKNCRVMGTPVCYS